MVELAVLCGCVTIIVTSYRLMAGRYCQHVYWSAMERRCMACGMSARELLGNLHRGWDTHLYPRAQYVFRDSPWREIGPWVRYREVPLPETSPYLVMEVQEIDEKAPQDIKQKFHRLMAMRRPLKGVN